MGEIAGRESLGDDWGGMLGLREDIGMGAFKGIDAFRGIGSFVYREARYGSEVRLNEIARPDELGAQEGGRYYTNLTYRMRVLLLSTTLETIVYVEGGGKEFPP